MKALVNKEQDIPHDFVVLVGEGEHTRFLMVPMIILTSSDMVIGGDEELPPKNDPAHPMVVPTQNWVNPWEPIQRVPMLG